MTRILYGKKIVAREKEGIEPEKLPEIFSEAVCLHRKLSDGGMRIAHAFIDPLMKSFEAGNHFFFRVFGFGTLEKLNGYRTGAGPVHALHDAKELVEAGLYDAVFIFGYDPLFSHKKNSGRDTIREAMDILDGTSILGAYNGLAEILCRELELSPETFFSFSDCLYENYSRTFARLHPDKETSFSRGRSMAEAGAPLFRLTDCANPNLDFAGGILVGSDAAASFLGIPEGKQIRVRTVRQAMVEADPEKLGNIVGKKEKIFPHLKRILDAAEKDSGLDFGGEFARKNLLLDVYTCYPPVPVAFLLAGAFIRDLKELPAFLEKGEITLTGGLSLAGAPWNNPVLRSLVRMWEELPRSSARYGMVHGNGGIGEAQGVVLLEKSCL